MTLMEALIAGGWLMLPLLGCSLVAVVIVVERLWALRASRIAPRGLGEEVCTLVARGQVNLYWLESHSPLGGVLAAGLRNARLGHEQVRARFQEAATAVVHDMERFLSPLGTIASITPLLGLLGTVVGMIEVFAVLVSNDGGERTADLAGGISRALVTTAAGLTVAIPALMFHRYFQRRVEDVTVCIEQQAGQVVEFLSHHDGELTLAERHEATADSRTADPDPLAGAGRP
ncbi:MULTISPECIES: MotA/TolQ/ExbB proton channel family protein [Halomonas]|uniref:Translocation protein TolQ n=1 Tax=Halomonas halophila TaxID=29573 RepID=A0ABQ0U0I1_9GAMM|nr:MULTISPECIES: MotA/TolQ/ExbB proton channel family protein [Halomonas]MDR5889509.1 MotA/TolQ/ExbB proton channel family protein [Halomonas salina]WJY06193.1 MotA/TolQ/ExbB proton channel family protein [Halomonas halophila]GEK71725.1 translocation protein TolQ [Halomonas halophila]